MKYYKRSFIVVISIISSIFALMLNSCEENSLDHNIRDYHISDEMILGKFLLRELKNDTKNWPVYYDERIVEYLISLSSAAKSNPRLKYSNDLFYNITIINTDKVFIFSLPGANYVISLGLLKAIDDESTMFALIANEVYKSNERIVTQKMLKEYTIYDLIRLSTDTSSVESKNLAQRVINNFDFIKTDLDDEYYLDSLTFYLTYSNERNVYGLKNFLEITKKNLDNVLFKEQLTLHAFSDKRIERLDAFMKKEKILAPTKQNTFYDFYQEFKKLLPK